MAKKHLPPEQLYSNLMTEIKQRDRALAFFLDTATAPYRTELVEAACLQFRKILELIAFSSLVANRTVYAAAYEKFATHWHAERLLADLARVNPHFYPVPYVEQRSNAEGIKMHHEPRTSDFLTRDEFVKAYHKCGALMHAANPYGSRPSLDFYIKSLPMWRARMWNLLSIHVAWLVMADRGWLIHMKEPQDDLVHAYPFEPVEQGRAA